MLFKKKLAVEEETQVPPEGLGNEGSIARKGRIAEIYRRVRVSINSGKMEDLRFVVFYLQPNAGGELEYDSISAFQQRAIGIPRGRLDNNSPVVDIRDECGLGEFRMKFPENR